MPPCNASVPDRNASGDNFYRQFICKQIYIDYFWNTYGFKGNKDYWINGFGWEDPCNADLPLGRTFNACYLLTYSAQDYQNDNWNAPQNVLQWGRRYVRNNIPRLRAKCGDGSAMARSIKGLFVKNRVELYKSFFYSASVVERAATLIHEARHQGGKSHNAKFPPGSIFGEGESGADSRWEYQGAWTFEIGYYWWFFVAGARTTTAMRQRARQLGNLFIDNAFATHPGFSI